MKHIISVLIGLWVILNAIPGEGQQLDSVQLKEAKPEKIREDSITQEKHTRDSTAQEKHTRDSTAQEKHTRDSTAQEKHTRDSTAQEKHTRDSIAQEKHTRDSIRARTSYIPTGIRIGTDLVSLVRIPIPDGFFGWQVSADIDINRYFLTGEFGRWERSISSASQQYSNGGYYFRIGADVAFFSKQRNKNIFFLGLRYGRSTFDEELSYTIDDASFGSIQKMIKNSGITASWFEVTAGFRMKLWKGLWMGYTIRIKPKPNVNHSKQLQSYDVPGFGQVSRTLNWEFNYQLFWRLGIRH